MIDVALLFALGFATAALLVALVSPAIHRRIVVYTERRLRATAPLGVAEVRAQKDMVRAVYAAEIAALGHHLARARDDAVALKVAADQATAEMQRARRAEAPLLDQIRRMSDEAADLRHQVRQAQVAQEQLQETLERSEARVAGRDLDLEAQRVQLHRLEALAASRDQEVSTHLAQIDDLVLRLQAMRNERDGREQEARALESRARKAEQRLLQEEDRVLRLEERLAMLQARLETHAAAEEQG